MEHIDTRFYCMICHMVLLISSFDQNFRPEVQIRVIHSRQHFFGEGGLKPVGSTIVQDSQENISPFSLLKYSNLFRDYKM